MPLFYYFLWPSVILCNFHCRLHLSLAPTVLATMCPLHILSFNLQSSNSFFSYHNSQIQTSSRNFCYEPTIKYPSIYFYRNIFHVTTLFYQNYLYNFLTLYFHNLEANKLLHGSEVREYLFVFFSSELDDDGNFDPRKLHFRWKTPGTHCVADYVGPRTGLKGAEERISWRWQNSKPDSWTQSAWRGH